MTILITNFSIIYSLKTLIYKKCSLTLVIIISVLKSLLAASSIFTLTELALIILLLISLAINIFLIKTLNSFSLILLPLIAHLAHVAYFLRLLDPAHNLINNLSETQ